MNSAFLLFRRIYATIAPSTYEKRGLILIIKFCAYAILAMGVPLTALYLFAKAIRHSATTAQKVLSVLWCALWGVLYALEVVPPALFGPLMCQASGVFVFLLTKRKAAITAFLLSFAISYVLRYTAVFPVWAVLMLSGVENAFEPPFYINFLVFAVQLLLAVLIFRIRRFRKGFPFLFEGYAIIAALIFSGAVLLLSALIDIAAESQAVLEYFLLLTCVLVTGGIIYIWIRRGIKKTQITWATARNEELLRTEIAEKDREIRQLKNNHETMRAANHSVNHRLRAMELRVASLSETARKYDAEFSGELALTMADIQKLSRDYMASLENEKADTVLPSTNVRTVDDIFALFAERFADAEIDFKLKVTNGVVYMAESVIERGKLETMIGEHLQNAMIAVNKKSARRCVLAIIGQVGGSYEFSVYDTGIPFETETLTQLGLMRRTTHSDEGGSGFGFMKTFETMRECGASLIIKENKPGGAFSKAVTVRFDDKNEYIIQTYRPDEFPPGGRYIIAGK